MKSFLIIDLLNKTEKSARLVADALDLDISLKARKMGNPNGNKVTVTNKKPSLLP